MQTTVRDDGSAPQKIGWIAFLAALLLLASFLRFWALNDVPAGLYFDESANGVDALRVIAGWHPIFFPGDQGREPLVIYLQAASLALVGPSPFALRLPSAMLGVMTVAVTYSAFRMIGGRTIGILGAALLAISYWHVTLSRHAFRTDALPLFTTLAAFWLFNGVRTGRPWAFGLGGAFLGGAFYTYIPARLAPPLFALWLVGCILIPAWRPRVSQRQVLIGAVVAAVTCIIVAIPLGWYFYHHPLDFIERVQNASPHPSNQTLTDGLRFAASALVVDGDPNPRHDLPGRPLLDVAVSIAGLVGILLATRRWRQSGYAFAFAWSMAMIFPAALSYEPAHALRLAGELPFVLLFPALALAGILGLRPLGRPTIAIVVVGIILVVSAAATTRDYFLVWANRPETYDAFQSDLLHSFSLLSRVPNGIPVLATTDVYEGVVIPGSFVPWAKSRVRAFDGQNTFVIPAGEANPVYYLYARSFVPSTGVPFANRLTSIATSTDPFGKKDGELFRYDLPRATLPFSRATGAVIESSVEVTGADLSSLVHPGSTARFALHWTVRGTLPPGNWEFFAHLVDRGQHRLLAADYNHGFPPDQWRDGDRVVSWFDLRIPDDAPSTVADVDFGVFDPATGTRLPVTSPTGEPAGTALIVGPIRIAGPEAPPLPPRHPLNVRFGTDITLEGYDVDKADNGDSIVRLHWRSNRPVTDDYTMFVHLLDSSGKFLVGADGQPGGGGFPTSTWQPGDMILDEHRIAAGANAKTLEIGSYLLSTGERLAAVEFTGNTGRSVGDALRLPW